MTKAAVLSIPLKWEGFSGASAQESVKPKTAATPAAVVMMDRY